MIRITDTIHIEEWELTEHFVRASGPGGQNVNKVSTAVDLRFEAERSPNLPAYAKSNLRRLAGRKWTKDGAIILSCDSFRSQALNREEARNRLVELLQKALHRQKRRIATRPGRGAVERRLKSKKQRGDIKKNRTGKFSSDE